MKNIKTAAWIAGTIIYLVLFFLAARSYITSNIFIDLSIPEEIVCQNNDKQIKVDVLVKNKTLETIDSVDNYFLSYHLYDGNGSLVSYDNIRTPLSAVGSGHTSEAKLLVDVPANGGEYFIKVDIVKENEFWYEDKGNKAAASRLIVKR